MMVKKYFELFFKRNQQIRICRFSRWEKNKSGKTTYSGSKTSNSKPRISRAKLYDNYLNITDSQHRKAPRKISNICPVEDCGGERILSQNDSYIVCKMWFIRANFIDYR
nr:A2L transcription factor [Mimivirus sp.]